MIEEKLKDFDADEKSFVCILLYLAGYVFSKEEYDKYIAHGRCDGSNAREVFNSMSMEKKSITFVMLGQALGCLPKSKGDSINEY